MNSDDELARHEARLREAERIIEALLFACAEPLDEAEMARRIEEGVDLERVLERLRAHYTGRGVNLTRVGKKWFFRTAADLNWILAHEQVEEKKLSRAALETLAIIAYHQPTTRAEIEEIRGVAISKGTLDAGERLFVDYAGDGVPVIVDRLTGEIRMAQIFVAVLAASSLTFARATWTQALPDWIDAHVHAFEAIGGVPQLIVPDNAKTAIVKSCFYDPQVNRTYVDMATHYATAILPARPRKPRDKAKVELAVLIVERWLLGRLRRRTFYCLAPRDDLACWYPPTGLRNAFPTVSSSAGTAGVRPRAPLPMPCLFSLRPRRCIWSWQRTRASRCCMERIRVPTWPRTWRGRACRYCLNNARPMMPAPCCSIAASRSTPTCW